MKGYRSRQFRDGDRVIVNTGGDDYGAKIVDDCPYSAALKGCVLVCFDDSLVTHWMNETHLRKPEAPDAQCGS